jgi:anti-sigma28 factor (negative regulator of flagellin synthesis)
LTIIESPELEAPEFPWKEKMNNSKTTKKTKQKSDLTKTQKIRSKLSIEADNLKESSSEHNDDEIKDVKILKIKNRIESGYYELQDIKNELIDSLFDRLFDDKND